jgi:hypothetical protein
MTREQRRGSAEDWLSDYLLTNGPTRRADIIDKAAKDRICSRSTLDRAALNLGIPRGWHWRLPS